MSRLMSQVAAHYDQRHKTGNHSNPERFNRITMQSVELHAAWVGGGDLVNWQLHRRTQRAHLCSDPPVSESRRQRDDGDTYAFDDQTDSRLGLSTNEGGNKQQQRNYKTRDIDHA